MEKCGSYFITGFPGFLSAKLIEGIFKRDKNSRVNLLYIASMSVRARREREELINSLGLEDSQIKLFQGDITKEQMGLNKDAWELLTEETAYVWHLAAIYDLAVERNLAYEINVVGTKNVNTFAESCVNIIRYIYFSTAYVAGKRTGKLKEDELIKPVAFHNFYEETKYEAETMVEALKEDVPITIIRPGIVKGDSSTGETKKFDGPYFIMNMLFRLRYLPFIPSIKGSKAVVNLVPVDYVIKAVLYLSHEPVGLNRTYHLTDPKPYDVSAVYTEMMKQLIQRKPFGSIPIKLLSIILSQSSIRRFLGVEKEALDYFIWEGHFDCSNTLEDLNGTDIICPDLMQGLPNMVHFYLNNKDRQEYHINIQ
ncbi:SDR family oxidoreductase [Falsibacillus albus]|uniref:NAD-dependent epimerase/dehydratase family protein n=1 Tax=Falsibacillus albus TaxID=2478915 RepID=A0A3L7K8Z5_9BACI|nr:SDR family oxidoreductase [Falsibacillus albus]RLQ97122.1 NAD-dependent epimerase/dehydratase family protein [Falsibacillus albus]